MSLKDLKAASATRKQKTAPVAEVPAQEVEARTPAPAQMDGRTKMLGARVPLTVHREFQGHLFRAQAQYPDLTTQAAMPALIRLLRDEAVWRKFMLELGQD